MGRVYDTARWQHLRALKLSACPLCEPCERRGRLTQASHVDHVVSIASGGDPYPDLGGLMSMCPPCHSIKTNAKDRAGGKGVAFKGCSADGLPLDPDHPFVGGSFPRQGDIPLASRGAVRSRPAWSSETQLVSELGGGKITGSGDAEIPREWF
ncbi:HNH endonuclease signature motif containing protein [uncultured Brevundimonas sp.]|uniref:HNH endonuclease signature motif containing protein n=1 Tax=uncultured Brevundimonas sp. TaxID=213418 RepID=UPI00345CA717